MTWTRFVEFVNRPLFDLGDTPVSLTGMVQFIVLIVLVVLASRTMRRVLRGRVLGRLPLGAGTKDAIARITGYVVLAIGLIVALQVAGIDLTTLNVLLGALGIGIGFGLQNVIGNFVSGLIILFEQPIRLGDRVEVGDTQGNVVRIAARSTTIRTNDNIDIIVPNSEFITERVINLSHGDNKVRIRIPFGVGYDSDPRKVERLALAVAGAEAHALKVPEPRVLFIGFGDSALKFELRAWTDELSTRPGVFRSNLYFALWETFKKNDIEIPFPQRDINFRNALKVEREEEGEQ